MQRTILQNEEDNWNSAIYNNSKYSHLQHHFEDEIFFHYIVPREVGKHQGKQVAEFGSGTGYLIKKILKFLNCDQVIGFDNSTSMIEKAKEKYANNPSILFQKLNLANDKQDSLHHQYSALISFFCFHWIVEQTNALKNVANALEENACGYIFVPGSAHFPKTVNPNKKSYVDLAKNLIENDLEFQAVFKSFNIERIKLSGDNYPEFIKAAGLELSEIIPINEEYFFSDFDDFSRFYQGILAGFLKFNDDNLSDEKKLQIIKSLCDKVATALIQQGTYTLISDGRVKSDEDFLLVIVRNANKMKKEQVGHIDPAILLNGLVVDNAEKTNNLTVSSANMRLT